MVLPKIKILVINSSPKANSQTAKFLNKFLKAAEKLGANVKTINLYQEKIPFVTGKLEQKLEAMVL